MVRISPVPEFQSVFSALLSRWLRKRLIFLELPSKGIVMAVVALLYRSRPDLDLKFTMSLAFKDPGVGGGRDMYKCTKN